MLTQLVPSTVERTLHAIICLGNTAISSGSNLQKLLALSTKKVEYVVMVKATKEMI